MIKKFIHQFASPKTYLKQVDKAYSYIFFTSLSIYLIAIFWGLFLTSEDFVQGHSYRIIYLHVPASFISQSLYLGMAFASAIFLIPKEPLYKKVILTHEKKTSGQIVWDTISLN